MSDPSYDILEVYMGPSGARLLGNVLHTLRVLRPSDPRNGAMIGQCIRKIQKITEKSKKSQRNPKNHRDIQKQSKRNPKYPKFHRKYGFIFIIILLDFLNSF